MPQSSQTSIAKMQQEVHELLPSISRAQANVLGEMVYGMMMTDSCGMTHLWSYLSDVSWQTDESVTPKVSRMYYEKEAKAGVKKRQCKRRELVPEEVFADLLAGVLKGWKGERTLVLALDASTLTDRFTVLSISVVYRGCGMRVAWTMQEGHQEGEWRPHWERMLKILAKAVPAGVDGPGDGRSGVVCTVALSCDLGQWVASDAAGQKEPELSGTGGNHLEQHRKAGEESGAWVERSGDVGRAGRTNGGNGAHPLGKGI